jgi:hypothetical protein
MNESNLATCFMPCLFRREDPDKTDPFKEMIEAKTLSKVLE